MDLIEDFCANCTDEMQKHVYYKLTRNKENEENSYKDAIVKSTL